MNNILFVHTTLIALHKYRTVYENNRYISSWDFFIHVLYILYSCLIHLEAGDKSPYEVGWAEGGWEVGFLSAPSNFLAL